MLKKITTLYGRVVLVQLIAIIVIMAVNGLISYRSNWTRVVEHMNEQIEQVSNRLAFQISLPFWNLDKNAANNILLHEINNPYLSGIAVLQDGKLWTGVVLNANKEVVLAKDLKDSSQLNFEGNEQPKIRIKYKDSREKTWELGDLVLYSTDEFLKKLFMSIIIESVIHTIILIVGISILTVILLNLFLNKPLEKITDTARRIGEGEIELQAELAGTREVLTLATAFNRMTSRLRDSLDAMRRMNEELEKRVAERTENLTLINKELESFSYSVSHDLRAPLRHINGFIKLLESQDTGTLNEKGKHYLQVISESAEKMGLLIDQLLQLSRTGRQELNKTQVSMNRLVRDVINGLSSETSNRSITWAIDDLPETCADPSMLNAVLTNLIGNALKFTRNLENTRIHIGSFAGEKRNETVYFVKDNGVGFDMKYLDKLFGVFQRLHSASEFEGTGIGLANVQRIINRHGGTVWAEGEIGHGASFYFSLING
ncbi:MAG: HAMP domain-containing protein [Fibrobacter sp.]|nr:HAMP domain-containing protein [Fibrobacter sp.]